MRDGEGAKMESSRQVEFSWTGEFEDFDRKWKHRDDRAQCGDDTSRSLWADNAHRFLALGKGEGEQDARKSSDVVGVEVREENRIEIAEAPAGVAPGDLGTFAAIDEHRVPLATDQERREPALRERHHSTGSEKTHVDHNSALVQLPHRRRILPRWRRATGVLPCRRDGSGPEAYDSGLRA